MDALSRKVWPDSSIWSRYLRKVSYQQRPNSYFTNFGEYSGLSTVPLHDLLPRRYSAHSGYGTNFNRITSRSSFVKWTLLFSTLIALDTLVWAARVALTCSSNSMANFEKFAVWERTLERASASVISLIDAINTVQTKNRIDSATTQGLWRNVFCEKLG